MGIAHSIPSTVTVKPPFARHAAAAFAASSMSCGISGCDFASVRSLKIRAEFTIAACSGCASGTLMTSIRKRAEFGSWPGASVEQPASSLGERTPAEPLTYT